LGRRCDAVLGEKVQTAIVSSLIGLCFDIVGAFLLAAEAIGTERIRSWKEHSLDHPGFVLAPHKTAEVQQRAEKLKLRWLPAAAMGISSGIGAGFGSYIALAIKELGAPQWLPFVGIVLGGLAGAFLIDASVLLMRSISRFLVWVEESAGKGTIGLAGFVLLSVGFMLQFVGTLAQAIAR
jgi:hypothetical protein